MSHKDTIPQPPDAPDINPLSLIGKMPERTSHGPAPNYCLPHNDPDYQNSFVELYVQSASQLDTLRGNYRRLQRERKAVQKELEGKEAQLQDFLSEGVRQKDLALDHVTAQFQRKVDQISELTTIIDDLCTRLDTSETAKDRLKDHANSQHRNLALIREELAAAEATSSKIERANRRLKQQARKNSMKAYTLQLLQKRQLRALRAKDGLKDGHIESMAKEIRRLQERLDETSRAYEAPEKERAVLQEQLDFADAGCVDKDREIQHLTGELPSAKFRTPNGEIRDSAWQCPASDQAGHDSPMVGEIDLYPPLPAPDPPTLPLPNTVPANSCTLSMMKTPKRVVHRESSSADVREELPLGL